MQSEIPELLMEMLSHIWRQYTEETVMEKFLTKEEMLEDGRAFLEMLMANAPVETVVSHFEPEEILGQFEPAIIEAYLRSIKDKKKKENDEKAD